MLRRLTPSALETTGTAVFRMVVSSDSMKNATATSHGSRRFTDAAGPVLGSATMTPPLVSPGGDHLPHPLSGQIRRQGGPGGVFDDRPCRVAMTRSADSSWPPRGQAGPSGRRLLRHLRRLLPAADRAAGLVDRIDQDVGVAERPHQRGELQLDAVG